MPRSTSIPSQDYAPGIYGPFAVDGFTKGDVQQLRLVLTVENWLEASPLVIVRVRWSNGDGADAAFAGGVHYDKAGQVLTEVALIVDVPQDAGGKANVVSGTVELEAHAPLRTAVTFSAV